MLEMFWKREKEKRTKLWWWWYTQSEGTIVASKASFVHAHAQASENTYSPLFKLITQKDFMKKRHCCEEPFLSNIFFSFFLPHHKMQNANYYSLMFHNERRKNPCFPNFTCNEGIHMHWLYNQFCFKPHANIQAASPLTLGQGPTLMIIKLESNEIEPQKKSHSNWVGIRTHYSCLSVPITWR